MRFNNEKPIFTQIADLLVQDVIMGRKTPQSRLPSARELAVSFEVNPNTAARALQSLADAGIAVCERGTGYFVSDAALEKARSGHRQKFFEADLPVIMDTMHTLGIDIKEVESAWKVFIAKKEHS